MVNKRRGEIEAVLGGKSFVLCLTLGALAELEAAMQTDDLNGIAERFQEGRISSRDLIAIIGAGLRGGGNAISNHDLEQMSIDGGAVGAAKIAAELLTATFGESEA